ncbi:MAG: hypothetical protein WA892_03555 [Ornithinimicrobium sp.]
MFAAGLILIILAIIVVIYVIFATSGLEPMSIDWGVFTADLTPLQLFFLGAVTVLVLAIGSVMLSVGLKSQGEKRAEMKRLRKEVEKTHDSSSTGPASTKKSRGNADRHSDSGSRSESDPDSDSDSGSRSRSTTATDSGSSSGSGSPARDDETASSESSTSTGRTRPVLRRRPSGETPPRPQSYRTSSEGSSSDSTPPSS